MMRLVMRRQLMQERGGIETKAKRRDPFCTSQTHGISLMPLGACVKKTPISGSTYSTAAIAWHTLSMFSGVSAATLMRPDRTM